MRELLDGAGMPAPDDVLHGRRAVVFLWYDAKALVLVDLDDDADPFADLNVTRLPLEPAADDGFIEAASRPTAVTTGPRRTGPRSRPEHAPGSRRSCLSAPAKRTYGRPRRWTRNSSPAAARSMYQPKRFRNSLAPTTSGVESRSGEWSWRDSNPRPSGCQPDALAN